MVSDEYFQYYVPTVLAFGTLAAVLSYSLPKSSGNWLSLQGQSGGDGKSLERMDGVPHAGKGGEEGGGGLSVVLRILGSPERSRVQSQTAGVRPRCFRLTGEFFLSGDASSLPTSKTAAAITSQAPVLVENLTKFLQTGTVGLAKYDGYTSCPVRHFSHLRIPLS